VSGKQLVKAAIRVERIVGFVEHVWSWTVVETEYSIPMAKVIGKVIQTMEWVAGWDSYDPAQTAAEILLMEDDLAYHREACQDQKQRSKVRTSSKVCSPLTA
jgi:hypothetical protein